MTTKASSNKLNRFTILPALWEMLEKGLLVFRDPKNWDDKNDTELLEIYRQRKGVNALLALCFLNDHETIHHWKTFANGKDGCCIEFDKAKLIKLFSDNKTEGVKFGIKFGSVVYKKLQDAVGEAIDDCEDMIPFKKRWPYRFEKEFRAIWTGNENHYQIQISDLTMITKITISHNMSKREFDKSRKRLTKLKIPSEMMNRSTIYENKCWIGKFRRKWPCPDLAS